VNLRKDHYLIVALLHYLGAPGGVTVSELFRPS